MAYDIWVEWYYQGPGQEHPTGTPEGTPGTTAPDREAFGEVLEGGGGERTDTYNEPATPPDPPGPGEPGAPPEPVVPVIAVVGATPEALWVKLTTGAFDAELGALDEYAVTVGGEEAGTESGWVPGTVREIPIPEGVPAGPVEVVVDPTTGTIGTASATGTIPAETTVTPQAGDETLRAIRPEVRLDGTSLLVFLGLPNRVVRWGIDGPGELDLLSPRTDEQGRAYAVYVPTGAEAGDTPRVQVTYGL